MKSSRPNGWIAVGCLAATAAIAHGPGPHVHGVASLEVAVDGSIVTMNLESPLDNLLGFEHPPRSEAERGALHAMVQRLERAETLFVPTPAAQCKPSSVKLASPVLEPEQSAAAGGHADLDGEFVFRCERPEALRDIEVTLFDGFPNLRQVDVQLATAHRQAAARLSREQRRIAW